MTIDRLIEIIKQGWTFVWDHHWADWQLLIIAGVLVVLVLLMIVRRRLKTTNRKQENVGTTANKLDITDHQRVKLLQQEIIQRDHTEERLERELTELTAANKKLRNTVHELMSVRKQPRKKDIEAGKSMEHKTDKFKVVEEQLRRTIAESNKALERSEQKIAKLTAANKQLQEQSKRDEEFYSQEMTRLTTLNEQLRQSLSKSHKPKERSEQKMSELTNTNDQHRQEVPKQNRADISETDERRKEVIHRPGTDTGMPLIDVRLKTKTPAQQLKELAQEIVDSGVQTGISDSPDARRQAILQACDYFDADDIPMTIEALKQFIASVAAQQSRNGEIPQKEEADDLMAAAQQIIDLLMSE